MNIRATRHRSGFTLIELLVVISIIVMLIAILMPSLGKAKAKSSQVTCATKVRGLGTAYRLYLAEWEGNGPMNGMIMPKSGVPQMYMNNPRFTVWEVTNPNKWRLEFGSLWTYMGGSPLDPSASLPLPYTPENMAKRYICQFDMPQLQRTYTAGDANGTKPLYLQSPTPGANPVVMQGVGSPGYWSYSINSVLNPMGRFRDRFMDAAGNGIPLPWSDPFKEVSMKYNNPGEFVTFIEEDNASLFNDEVMDPPAYSQGDLLTNRHNFGGNVGFLDAHVDFYKATEFNYQPSALSGTYVDHTTAMQSPITRMFFPDKGRFAN